MWEHPLSPQDQLNCIRGKERFKNSKNMPIFNIEKIKIAFSQNRPILTMKKLKLHFLKIFPRFDLTAF